MSKKVLYLGAGKWCWTENCKTHTKLIKIKNDYLKAVKSNNTDDIQEIAKQLKSTPEGLATYRYLEVQKQKGELGRNPLLGLDVDGTTANFTSGLRNFMAKGLTIPQSEWLAKFPEPDEYAMWLGSNAWYKDKAEFLENFKEAELSGMYRDVSIYDNASNILNELKNYGFDIQVITARSAEFNNDTLHWMKKHNIPIKSIINSGFTKHDVKGIDLFIDDAPHVVNGLLENQQKVVVMDQSYNGKHIPDHKNSRHVKAWDDNIVNAIFDLIDNKK